MHVFDSSNTDLRNRASNSSTHLLLISMLQEQMEESQSKSEV
jgi:hypothetical protein